MTAWILAAVGFLMTAGLILGSLKIRRLEAEARDRTRLHRLILDSVGEGVVIADQEGRFKSFNPAAERIVGMGMVSDPSDRWQEIYGVYLPDETTPYPHDRFPLVRALRGEDVHGEVQFIRHAGRPQGVWIEVTARPKRGPSGEIEGAIAVFRDVSARRAAENGFRRSEQDLEQFAHVASHDLQEPLRMVSSYTRLLEERYKGKLDPEADEFIAFAVDGAGRMHKMIQDLLEFSRLHTRASKMRKVSLAEVLERVMLNLRKEIDQSEARIEIGDLPEAEGDEIQLGQLFQNLLGNAMKFHGEAPPRIHVGGEEAPQGLRFWVRDNGIGIDPRHADRIFGIFQRLHARDRYPGTGIGLALCKRIVERHGGRIWVESRPGGGSTFHFTLSPIPSAGKPA